MIPPPPVPCLGIVIPTLNEAEHLPRLLQDLRPLSGVCRVVVSDGGSSDTTEGVARSGGALFLRSPRGRARQMNAGASVAGTRWLLFLHADCRLPEAARLELESTLATDPPSLTCFHFRFRLNEAGSFWRFIEAGQRVRENLTGMAYGDQGLLISRDLFREAGGFPDLPIMEDVVMLRKIRSIGGRVTSLSTFLPTSPRRYQTEGPWRAWIRNTALIGLHAMGADARRLARWYPFPVPRREARPPEEPWTGTVLLFAKAPRAGDVKTRLAREVGEGMAVEIYREMGRRVTGELAAGPLPLRVVFSPEGAESEMRRWLPFEDVAFEPQVAGDLGMRMEAGIRNALSVRDRVCVVGADLPGLRRAVVEQALAALSDADVVLGPAADGGYYLLAVSEPHPELFRDMPWSSSGVLAETVRRADRLGLRIRLLSEARDVDTAEDLEATAPELLKAVESRLAARGREAAHGGVG